MTTFKFNGLTYDLDGTAEVIAAGDPCPICERPWRPDRKHGGLVLHHETGCAFMEAVKAEAQAYFADHPSEATPRSEATFPQNGAKGH